MSPWQANFANEKPRVAAGNFALSFSLEFLSISMHTSGSIELITLIWVSSERSFPPAQVEHAVDDAHFGQR